MPIHIVVEARLPKHGQIFLLLSTVCVHGRALFVSFVAQFSKTRRKFVFKMKLKKSKIPGEIPGIPDYTQERPQVF